MRQTLNRTENGSIIIKRKLYEPYIFMLGVYAVFMIAAFSLDTPSQIWFGLIRIVTSRSGLFTDYIALGGIGATLVNSVAVGLLAIAVMVIGGVKPNGSIIMGLWLSTGFAFFGKNVFNMIPITIGVYIYAKMKKQPFINVALSALLSATLSPIVSELAFHPAFSRPVGLTLGISFGILVGIIFPPLSAALVRVHGGYCLYNMGFAGGLIATFVVSLLKSVEITIVAEQYWSTGNNVQLSVGLYLLGAALILFGIFFGGTEKKLKKFRRITKETGRLVTDFYSTHGYSCYINMGLLCILGTTVILLLGGDVNGPTIGAVLTMVGFGAFGKHMKNVTPVLIGAIICTYWNTWDPKEPLNMLAILFSSCLAPIAGQFGWLWGVIAGFLHVTVANFAGVLNGGLNLYNNGWAGGFVAMFTVPLVNVFKRDKDDKDEA